MTLFIKEQSTKIKPVSKIILYANQAGLIKAAVTPIKDVKVIIMGDFNLDERKNT